MNKDETIDYIFDSVDRLLREGNFDLINKLLSEVTTNDITILVAWLSITCIEKEKLPARLSLIERIKVLVPERSEGLLKGLE